MGPRAAPPARWILLTGAGFTVNFGGFLSTEVWQRIYNIVSEHEELRTLLQRNLDFEGAYHEVLTGEFSEESKRRFVLAVLAAFREMHNVLKEWNWTPGSAYPVNEYAIRSLISRFAGIRYKESGYLFTLNQDLFVEMIYCVTSPDKNGMILPGIDAAGLP